MAGELLSVWNGSDGELLDRMLEFYPDSPPRAVLDCTYNTGRMWKGSKWADKVVGMDIDPSVQPHIVDDNRVMKFIGDASQDVAVYDPPHVPNQGRDRKKDFQERFGLTVKAGKEEGYSLRHTHGLVLKQVKRVLVPGGVLFAKIADYVHNHRYSWAVFDFVQAVKEVGMVPCDMIVKVRKGPIQDPRWVNRHHARRTHCSWVVVRNGSKCERGKCK
jgi:hypothetical protein